MEKLKHPHSSQVLKVIQAFESVLPMAKARYHLDMHQAQVTSGSEACGTTHCHGGWFSIACKLHLRQYCGFLDGADRMAEILGFDDNYILEQWAAENPIIWGNYRGRGMFCAELAFASPARPDGAKNLQHIIDHWREVRERLLALENPYQTSAISELAQQAMEDKIETDVVMKETQTVKN